ncbi:unnamed protein product [Closterium sp. Naga37s-1]|nr:unnamed protein product [Closterium sp. Naga37s-1]
MDGLLEAWPSPFSPIAWKIIGTFAAFEALLQVLLPGKEFVGPVSPAGNRPIYWCNGFQAYMVSIVTYIFIWRAGWFNPSLVYDNFGSILSALNVVSLLLCLFLYAKGHLAPSSSDWGSSGNFIQDFFWGMELYPRIGKYFDIKTFTNCRFGMMSWALLAVTYAIKQLEASGSVADSMVVSVALMLVYISKFFYWESGYWSTMDIQHDRAGYYLCWGCMVWVPCIYTSPALYLVNHPLHLGTPVSTGPPSVPLRVPACLPACFSLCLPACLPAYPPLLYPFPLFLLPQSALLACIEPVALAMFLCGCACIAINYDSDRQRQHFRSTHGRCTIWGRPPAKIEADYVTEKGENKKSLLLASGWWGLSRHFHYVPEILASFFWTFPALFNNGIQYFYCIYLTVLLFDRAVRDDVRCKKKYGKFWDKYCKLVPYKVVPGIF